MDRTQLIVLGLPILFFCWDVVSLFSSSPSTPIPPPHHRHSPVSPKPTTDFLHPNGQIFSEGGVGLGHSIELSYCTSCSYRGTAVTMKRMLEASFPGINVILSSHPPILPKRVLSKVVPVIQVGVIAIIVAGEQIFPRLGYSTPPPWYFSLRANKFGSIASTWLLGNVLQNFLQNSGAFEVYCNGELVFSKLQEQRFPSEFELRDIIARKIGSTKISNSYDGAW